MTPEQWIERYDSGFDISLDEIPQFVGDAAEHLRAALAEIAHLRAIPDLIRKRYPRMLERGNPLFDGVLADLLERCGEPSASAQQGAVVVPEVTGSQPLAGIDALRSQEGGA